MLGGGRLTSHDRRKFLLDHDKSIDIFTNVMFVPKKNNRPPLEKTWAPEQKWPHSFPVAEKISQASCLMDRTWFFVDFPIFPVCPTIKKRTWYPTDILSQIIHVYITIHLSSLGTFHVGILTHIYQHHFSPFGYVDPPPKRTYRAPFTHPRLTLPGGHSKELALSIASGTPKGAIKHGAACVSDEETSFRCRYFPWRIHGKWYIYLHEWLIFLW